MHFNEVGTPHLFYLIINSLRTEILISSSMYPETQTFHIKKQLRNYLVQLRIFYIGKQ